jgi:hypothetical protein
MKISEKIIFFGLYTLSQSSYSQNNLLSNFGEVSAMYIGSCYAIEYLKHEKCRSIATLDPIQCQQKIVQLLPSRFKTEMDQTITRERQEIRKIAVSSVDIGFKKVMNTTNNDIEKSCLGYATVLNTYTFSQFEELKRIAKLIK